MGTVKPRRWLRYVLVASGLALLGAGAAMVISHRLWNIRREAQQRAALEEITRLGGEAAISFYGPMPLAAFLERNNAPNIILLNSKNLTDDDLRVFESAPTTRSLSLFDNRITDQGLVHLKNLHSLEFLDLRRNGGVTDAGLIQLETLHKLQHLYLIRTGVTAAGVSKLQKKLPNTKIAF
jgi:hypothetical protein